MAGDESDGLLSQEDIDAAMREAAGSDAAAEPAASEPAPEAVAPEPAADEPAVPASAASEPAEVEPTPSEATAEANSAAAKVDADLADEAAQLLAESMEADDDEPAVDERLDSAGRPFDEVAAAMAEAIASESGNPPVEEYTPGPLPAGAAAVELPQLTAADLAAGVAIQGIDLLRDVQLNVKIELGRSRMLVDDVLRLGEGSVVELDKLAGDPVDVFVNDRLVARGEVLVLNDNFCVRINEIVQRQDDDEDDG